MPGRLGALWPYGSRGCKTPTDGVRRAVYRRNEKGRVERSIRYIRDNFFAGRQYTSLHDLNQQALAWCDTTASNRPCPEDKSKTVSATFLEEQARLIPLPDNPYPCDEVETVSIGKTPYARFDLNDYSVPHTLVRQSLVVRATLDSVNILNGMEVIATHARSYDKAKQIETEEHIKTIATYKRALRRIEHKHNNQRGKIIMLPELLLHRASTMNFHGVISHCVMKKNQPALQQTKRLQSGMTFSPMPPVLYPSLIASSTILKF